MVNKVDIWSKGEVVKYMQYLVAKGKIKECSHFYLSEGHMNYFVPECSKEWASALMATNVFTDMSAYTGPSSYSWPKCPDDCPYFEKSDNFVISLSENDPYAEPNENSKAAINTVERLTVPEKVTLSWLSQNVPIKIWGIFISVIIAAFFFGFGLGKTDVFVKVYDIITQSKEDPTSSTKKNGQ